MHRIRCLHSLFIQWSWNGVMDMARVLLFTSQGIDLAFGMDGHRSYGAHTAKRAR